MARFDFVECTARAYRYSWENRRQILGLAAPAIVFKILTFMVVLNFFEDLSLLRQNLFILPSYYFEGWVICTVLAGIFLSSAQSDNDPYMIRRNIQAATIVYVLIKLMLSFIMGMTFMNEAAVSQAQQSQTLSAQTFFLMILTLGFLIWSFRFLWLYVPVVIGYNLENFLKAFQSFKSSFYMIGVWLLCLMPMGLVLLLASGVLASIFPQAEGMPATFAYKNAMTILQAFLDFMISLIASLAMAYGIHSVMSRDNRKKSL